jgi:hypothetical protein
MEGGEESCFNQGVGNVGKFIFFKEMICNFVADFVP